MIVTTSTGERPHELLPAEGEPVACWCRGEFFECDEGHAHYTHNQPYICLDTQPRLTIFSH